MAELAAGGGEVGGLEAVPKLGVEGVGLAEPAGVAGGAPELDDLDGEGRFDGHDVSLAARRALLKPQFLTLAQKNAG